MSSSVTQIFSVLVRRVQGKRHVTTVTMSILRLTSWEGNLEIRANRDSTIVKLI
jgi:hypothetical protein